MDLISSLDQSCPSEGLTAANLATLEKMFRAAIGTKKEMDVDAFKKICPSKTTFFMERLFRIFDADRSGSISLAEFMEAMCKLSRQSQQEKLKHIFDIYDLNDDGTIQFSELRDVISECMNENGLRFGVEELDELTKMLFEDADTDGSGCITFEEFQDQLRRHPAFMENLTLSVERWLLPPRRPQKKREFLRKLVPHKLELKYITNNLTSVVFFLGFLFVNIALFISRAAEYWDNNYYVIIARACGQCLNFNCSFLMLLVLRQSLTFLRTHGFSHFLPIDQHLYFHKLTGYFILVYSILHTVMHVCNLYQISIKDDVPLEQHLISLQFGGWFGFACPTGWILLLILIVMFMSSLPAVRRRGKFEVFHHLHRLAWLFWICLLLHGCRFWMWIVAPAVLFIIETIIRLNRSYRKSRKTYVQQGILLPSKVTHLVVRRPLRFEFKPGDYVYIRIPTIAKYEWHPFTISSAPEMEDVIWLHIRGVGGWTNTLYSFFERFDKEAILSEELARNIKTVGQEPQSKIRLNKQNSESALTPQITNTDEASVYAKNLCSRSISENPANLQFQKARSDSKSFSNNLRLTIPAEVHTTSTEASTEQQSNKEEKPTLNKIQISCSSSLLDEKETNANNIVGLNYRTLTSIEEGPLETAEPPTTIAQRIRNKRRSVRVSVSNKSFGQRQTAIIMPTLKSDEELGEGDSALNENLRMKEEGRDGEMEGEPQNVILAEKPLKIFLDGPYGSPTRHIFQARHAVLIATGIGVTPYASILQSIMHKYRISMHTCPNCSHKWTDTGTFSCLHLRKVDFFWLNRNQRCFEWFVSLLSELEIEQAQLQEQERFLDMHMYITSALHRADMKAVGLQMAMNLLYQKEKRCLITGLKNRTQPGRPDWNKVFKDISAQNKGKVTVFFCGSQQLAKTLHEKCDEFGFKFRKEIF